MTNVQVRDVPPNVVAALKARASARHQSLQSYLLDLLEAEAAVETNRAFFEQAATEADYPAPWDEAAASVRQARQERNLA